MPRNMSFAMTTEQFKNKTKTVTRRFGWWFLKPGDVVCGVEKAMGLKKGEKVKKLGLVRIVSVRKERLVDMQTSDCALEGFPKMTSSDFIAMLCSHNVCSALESVNRIEFEYL